VKLLVVDVDNKRLKNRLHRILERYESGRWLVVSTAATFTGPPVRVDDTFEDLYDVRNGFNERWVRYGYKEDSIALRQLDDALARSSEVYLATSPGLRGETTAWQIARYIGMPNPPRVVINDISYWGVIDAIKTARPLDLHAIEAGRARNAVDFLLLTNGTVDRARSLHCAEVLRMLVARQHEHSLTNAEQFHVTCSYRRPGKPWRFTNQWELDSEARERLNASYSCSKTRKMQLASEARLLRQAALRPHRHVVRSIDYQEVISYPPTPLRIADLLRVMSCEHAMDVQKTMSMAELLFQRGYITWPKTDSAYLCEEAVENVRGFVETCDLAPFLADQPAIAVRCRLGQEAIRPVEMVPHPSGLPLHDDAYAVYSTVFFWTILSQLKPSICIQETVVIDIDVTDRQITGEHLYVTQAGWQQAYVKASLRPLSGDYGHSTIAALQTPGKMASMVGHELELDSVDVDVEETELPWKRSLLEHEVIEHFEKNRLLRSCYLPFLFQDLCASKGIDYRWCRSEERRVLRLDDRLLLGTDTLRDAVGFDDKLCGTHALGGFEAHLNEVAHGRRDRVSFLDDFYRQFHADRQNRSKSARPAPVNRRMSSRKETPRRPIGFRSPS
jgi:DNA topoisomerase IA